MFGKQQSHQAQEAGRPQVHSETCVLCLANPDLLEGRQAFLGSQEAEREESGRTLEVPAPLTASEFRALPGCIYTHFQAEPRVTAVERLVESCLQMTYPQ